ncbi:hypothetical protein JCM9279_003921 [Rhodotorula babjevae]
MPPPTQQLRQRLPLVLFLLVSLALLAATAFTSTDDYSQYAAVGHHDAQQSTRLRVQPDKGPASDISTSSVTAGKRLRVGLGGAGGTKGKQVVGLAADSTGDDLFFTVQRRDDSFPSSSPAQPPHSSSPALSTSPHPAWAYVRNKLDSAASSLGDLILGVFGFDEEDWFGMGDFEGDPSETGIDGGGLASWSESSVYVERTNSLHPSRPSSFGPHLLTEPLHGLLFPVESVLPTDSFGCKAHPVIPAPVHEPSTPWVALVQRGRCPFSQKVRFAQEHGAMAVVFGDESEEEGGISGGHGLLTPWSPEDSSDITIPSTFVSRASYLSLLRTWQDEQDLAKRVDAPARLERSRHRDENELVGLEVVLSKDEVFAWPLLDLLFMLLFLPSLLTLVTVLIQRIRVARASKAERAPKDAVARLPVFRWGEAEKPVSPAAAGGASPATTLRNLDQDEEREVGIAHVPVSSADEGVTEETALLAHDADEHAHTPSLFQRLSSRLPTSFTRLLPARLCPAPPPTPQRARARATRRYPSLTECPFCLSDFEAGDLVMELPCSHVFHAEEIETWLQQQRGICPICRTSVLAPPQDDAVVGSAAAAAAAAAEDEGQGPIDVDGVALPVSAAAVLVEPLRAPPGTTDTTTGASPVASSSSVPLEGTLARSSAPTGSRAD